MFVGKVSNHVFCIVFIDVSGYVYVSECYVVVDVCKQSSPNFTTLSVRIDAQFGGLDVV